MPSHLPPFPPQSDLPEPEQPKRKRSVGKMLAIGLGVVLLLIIVVSVASGGGSSSAGSSAPAISQPPVTYALPAPAKPAAPATSEKPAGPATTASDGVYEVGVDLAPGRYKTAGPDASDFMPNCYYARLKDDSGDLKSIIANDNLQGPGSVTVKAGEFVKFSGGCEWSKA